MSRCKRDCKVVLVHIQFGIDKLVIALILGLDPRGELVMQVSLLHAPAMDGTEHARAHDR
jgi:hypothetical protein